MSLIERLRQFQQPELSNAKVILIGGGKMGGAVLLQCIKNGDLKREQVVVATKSAASKKKWMDLGIENAYTDVCLMLRDHYGAIIFAVKPQIFKSVADEIVAHKVSLQQSSVIISIMAGISIEKIKHSFAFVENLAKPLGIYITLPESQMDAGGAIASSGPAFVLMMMEAMADGGVLVGLSRTDAVMLARQAFKGAAVMAMESGEHTAILRDQICSAGGSTIAGIRELENGAARGAIMNAVKATMERSASFK